MRKSINVKHQAGYTLIELMIAGMLGVMFLLGIMQVYLGASQTNRLQAGVRDVQDTGRFILTYLEKDIQRAGWAIMDPGINLTTLETHIDFDTGQSTNGTSTDNNKSDTIAVVYESDSSFTFSEAPRKLVAYSPVATEASVMSRKPAACELRDRSPSPRLSISSGSILASASI